MTIEIEDPGLAVEREPVALIEPACGAIVREDPQDDLAEARPEEPGQGGREQAPTKPQAAECRVQVDRVHLAKTRNVVIPRRADRRKTDNPPLAILDDQRAGRPRIGDPLLKSGLEGFGVQTFEDGIGDDPGVCGPPRVRPHTSNGSSIGDDRRFPSRREGRGPSDEAVEGRGRVAIQQVTRGMSPRRMRECIGLLRALEANAAKWTQDEK